MRAQGSSWGQGWAELAPKGLTPQGAGIGWGLGGHPAHAAPINNPAPRGARARGGGSE